MRHRLSGLVAVTVIIAGLCLLSLAVGARPTPHDEVFEAVAALGSSTTETAIIVWDQRLPRTVLAVVVGSAVGLAGALAQGHTRNPLADPGMLGISAGAALAVVISVYLFRAGSIHTYVWAALIGAGIGAAIVFFIASIGGGSANPLSLILAGAALSAFFGSVSTAIILRDQASLDTLRFWNAGSVTGRDLGITATVLPFICVGLVLGLSQGPVLNLLAVGADTATGLGINVARARAVGFLAITVLTGAATAASGPIAFLGLMVPHAVRAVTGPDYRWVLPYSAAAGAMLVLAADIVGRVVVRPGELQVGIVLAFVGAPFFIALVRRRKLVNI
nr:iron ABC transporter permease [Corynebacterium mendelii]